mgnify:CR=1 FL=1
MIRSAKSHHGKWPKHSLPFDGWLCFPAGHAALGCMALGVDARKRLMGGLFVFFAFGGETGLINENEGDI